MSEIKISTDDFKQIVSDAVSKFWFDYTGKQEIFDQKSYEEFEKERLKVFQWLEENIDSFSFNYYDPNNNSRFISAYHHALFKKKEIEKTMFSKPNRVQMFSPAQAIERPIGLRICSNDFILKMPSENIKSKYDAFRCGFNFSKNE